MEHHTEVGERVREVRSPEKDPPHQHHQQSVSVSEWRWSQSQQSTQPKPLQHQKRPVIEAPNDEAPGRAVPKAGQQEDDQQIAHSRP